ncbi:ABC transporter ATP-binding protein [Lachnospiraceae bacterium 62-35]
MKELLKYLKQYKRESFLGPLFKMLEATFELFIPLVVARIIDVGIRNQDKGYILKMGSVLVLLGIVGLAASLTAQYFSAKAAVGACTSLRNALFAHINGLSYSELDKLGTSTLITRMTSDINQVQTGVNLFLRLFLRSPFIVFGAAVMAFTVNVKAAFTFVVVIPLLSVVVFGIMLISMPLYKRVQRMLDRVMLTTRENLEGVRVIRAFNRQEDEIKRFKEENDALVRVQVFVGKISALMNPFTYVIINGGILVLVWIAGDQVNKGIITQGETVALWNYMSQILIELIKLANLIINISKALACAGRVQKVFEERTSIGEKEDIRRQELDNSQTEDRKQEADSSQTGDRRQETGGRSIEGGKADTGEPSKREAEYKVEFNQIRFFYEGGKEPALEGVSLQVKKGETIGIIGGTGSGKSSLVNLIPRFYDVREGSVKIDGVDVKDYRIKTLRDKIGVVPQRAVLFAGTLRDNMRWGRENAGDEEIYQALEIAQAREFVDSKGKGLDLPITQEGKNLSGGQRQRLTIARALVRKPEILIMDDSASALDFATDARLRKAIREETDGMTVFIVSQRASSIKNADKIIVMDDGMMAGCGTHRELLETCSVYREICLSQLSKEEVQ